MSSELLVSRLGRQTWATLRENGSLVEIHADLATGDRARVGRIVRGRVSRVLPGIQSAFLEIGEERGGFLHVSDLLLPGERPHEGREIDAADIDAQADLADEGPAAAAGEMRRWKGVPIEDRLKVGRDLLVQVAREGRGSKGARVTCFIALPGRRVVYAPYGSNRAVSRRIRDPQERERLLDIVRRLAPTPAGYVARTAAVGASQEAIEAESRYLTGLWRRVQAAADSAPVPGVVHREPDLLLRLLRDLPSSCLDRIVVDDPRDRERAIEFLQGLEPELVSRLTLHTEPVPLLECGGTRREIERLLHPRVWLKSGGYVVIEDTEALVSIDVNSGKFVGRRKLEDTALRTNVEAAEEIARQLRLRDLGGIIVIDFIDLEVEENRIAVIEALQRALGNDRQRTVVVGWNELGLLLLTRKRTRRDIAAALTLRCRACEGMGRVKRAEFVVTEALLALRKAASSDVVARRIEIHAAAPLARTLEEHLAAERSARADLAVAVRVDPSLTDEAFEIHRVESD